MRIIPLSMIALCTALGLSITASAETATVNRNGFPLLCERGGLSDYIIISDVYSRYGWSANLPTDVVGSQWDSNSFDDTWQQAGVPYWTGGNRPWESVQTVAWPDVSQPQQRYAVTGPDRAVEALASIAETAPVARASTTK
jgi:hypothetical protein